MRIQNRIKRVWQILLNTVFIYTSSQIKYYNQYSLQYFFKLYGEEKMGVTACGPFACAIASSSLLKKEIRPDQVAKWSYENGFYEYGHGSFHSLIPMYFQNVGLQCDDLGYRIDELQERLEKEDAMGILLCREKTFAGGRHFVVVGLQKGKFKVYNSSNVFDCYKKFEKEEIQDALAVKNVYIGPIWCISKI